MLLRILLAMSCLIIATNGIAEDRLDASRQMVDALDRQARQQVSANQAFQLYQQFERTNTMSGKLREIFDSRLGHWKERSDKGLVRLGSKWVTPALRQEVAAETRQMVDEAFTLIKFGDKDGARKKLLEASRHDRNAILPDFVLGVLNSGKWSSDSVSYPEHAIKHFKVVLQRAPQHVGAMNNLAVAYLKEGEVRRAVRYWEDAKALDPDNSAVKHNVRRALFESTRGTIDVNRGTLDKLRNMVTVEDASVPLEGSGLAWAISPVVVPDIEQAEPADPPEKSDDQQIVSSSSTGTGFVVAPNYVLTNCHVIKDELYGTADVVQVSIPGSGNEPVVADVVAVSEQHDLALLRTAEFNAPALNISLAEPRLGSEVMAIGFPLGDQYGQGVKVTRGSIVALPEPSHERLLYDALLNAGNSGGPLLGRDGNVVAVNTFYTTIGRPMSGGVPGNFAIEFVVDCIPDFSGVPATDEIAWPDIAELGAKSTVLVSVLFADAAPVLARDGQASVQATYFADRSCAHCKGWGKVACPHPKCSGGGILKYKTYTDVVAASKLGITTQKRRKGFKSRCPTCSGDNAVSCRFCGGSGTAR